VTPGPEGGGWLGYADEAAVSVGVALVAGYLRAREARPWTLASVAARVAEAVVCGCIAMALSAHVGGDDPRLTAGISAGLGLLGTTTLTDFAARLAARWPGRAK